MRLVTYTTVDGDADDAVALRLKETAFGRLAVLHAKSGRASELKALMAKVKPFMSLISKAKGGKLFRLVLGEFLSLDEAVNDQVAVCTECITWTRDENRRFLRQALEVSKYPCDFVINIVMNPLQRLVGYRIKRILTY